MFWFFFDMINFTPSCSIRSVFFLQRNPLNLPSHVPVILLFYSMSSVVVPLFSDPPS